MRIERAMEILDTNHREHYESIDIVNEACEMGRRALEKQIPMKPVAFERTACDFETGICPYSHYECERIKPYSHEYKYTDYKCPSCDKVFSDGTPNYCCYCGQALDWSEE